MRVSVLSAIVARRGVWFERVSEEEINIGAGTTSGVKINGMNQQIMSDRGVYERWKTTVPYIYDFFTNHHIGWPSLSAR